MLFKANILAFCIDIVSGFIGLFLIPFETHIPTHTHSESVYSNYYYPTKICINGVSSRTEQILFIIKTM